MASVDVDVIASIENRADFVTSTAPALRPDSFALRAKCLFRNCNGRKPEIVRRERDCCIAAINAAGFMETLQFCSRQIDFG